jgi:hypothetical protein
MRPIYLTLGGVNNASITAPIVLDQYIAPGAISIFAILAGGTGSPSATVTLQVTNDDIFASNYAPNTGNWFSLPANTFTGSGALTSASPTAEATLSGAIPRAMRATFSGCVGAPNVTFQVAQMGIGGT